MLDITEVRIQPYEKGKLKAYATLTLSGCFVVRGLKVIDSSEGLFVAMPTTKLKSGEKRDIAHPINQETREFLEDRVLSAYEAQGD